METEIIFALMKGENSQKLKEIFQNFGKVTSLQEVIIPEIHESGVKIGFICIINIEISRQNLERFQSSKATKREIQKLVLFLKNMDRKFYHIMDIVGEMSISKLQYESWLKRKFSNENILDLYEKGLNHEEKLNKWFRLVYFLVTFDFHKELRLKVIDHWLDLLENSEEVVYTSVPTQPELLTEEDPSLNMNNSLFMSKQKIGIYLLTELFETYPDKFYERFIDVLVGLESGFKFIKEQSNATKLYCLVQRLRFISYFTHKTKLLNLRVKEIEESLRVVEFVTGAQL
jgi:hypothetical protein